MKFVTLLLTFFVAAFFTLAGCKGTEKKEQEPRILATVNGTAITTDDVLLRLGGHGQYMSSPLKDRALEEIVNEELLYQRGVKLGLDKDAKFQNNIRSLERKLANYKRTEMSRRVRDTQISANVNVTDQDVKDYYATHAEEISTDLHLGVLQFDDEAQAKDALARIRSGAPFEQVAAEKSPHAAKGKSPWDMGYLRWDQIQLEMSGAVYGLKKGEVSGVLISQSGVYIVKLIERKKNPNAGYDALKTVIENRLTGIKIKEAYDRYVQQLKNESSIKRN